MTKPELLRLMRLLSALESLLMYRKPGDGGSVPDYLLEEIASCVELIEKEILR